jgi:hypothetical protein
MQITLDFVVFSGTRCAAGTIVALCSLSRTRAGVTQSLPPPASGKLRGSLLLLALI